MKLNIHAFPYPVLTDDQGNGADYNHSAFQCSLLFSPSEGEDNSIELKYGFILSNNQMKALIEEGSASFALEIRCSETLKREVRFLNESGDLRLDALDLYGKVEFTPIVVVRKPVQNYTSPDLNEEFNGATFELERGDIIAVDHTETKYIEFNNLSFDSLIKTRLDTELKPFQYRIDPSPSIIHISMGKEMKKIWNEMKISKNLKPAVAMSIYKDVIHLAIEDLIEDKESESQQWARSLKNKISSLGFSLPKERDFNSINLLAQELVQDIGIKKYSSRLVGD